MTGIISAIVETIETILKNLVKSSKIIFLNVNINKTVFTCFRLGIIFVLKDKPLKFADQFTYFRSNISFNESNMKIITWKASTAIDGLSIILKSDKSDEIKKDYHPSFGRVSTRA